MQFFVSETAVNQAMKTLFDNETLMKGFRVPSTYLKTSFPNFEEVYGKQDDVFILIEAMSAPVVHIRTDSSRAYFDMSVRLLNPHNEEFDAVKTRISIMANLEFELLEDFTLVGKIGNVMTEVKEF